MALVFANLDILEVRVILYVLHSPLERTAKNNANVLLWLEFLVIQWMENVYALLDILEKNVTKNALLVFMECNVLQNVIVKMGLRAISAMDFVIALMVGVVLLVLCPVGVKQQILNVKIVIAKMRLVVFL